MDSHDPNDTGASRASSYARDADGHNGPHSNGSRSNAPYNIGAHNKDPHRDDPSRQSPAPNDAALWNGGWHVPARVIESPNFGPRPAGASVDMVVIHSISLPPGIYEGDAVQALFTNRLDGSAHPYFETLRGLQVSAHFFIRRDGELQQYVSCDERAWHAGQSVYRGRSQCNDNSVGIELEGIEGGNFEAAQYRVLCALCRALAQRYPVSHVTGHEHIAPVRKQDPGPGFDWATLRQQLAWSACVFPV